MTLVAALAAYFQQRPNQWVPAERLLEVAGSYAWRTRISDLRRPPYGMIIENEWHTETFMGRSYRVTRYRFVPSGKGNLSEKLA
jgi:hypothetical protein